MSSTVKILEPSGNLNATKGNELRREISDILSAGGEVILIDLKNVTFIDSSGLGALVAAMQSVRKANAKLFICSINDQVRMVFELTRIDRILNVYADREDFNRQVLATQ